MKTHLPVLLFLCIAAPSQALGQYSGPALAPEGWVIGVMPAAEKEREIRIENGLLFLELGFYKSALREFRAAYKLKPLVDIRFHVGRTLYLLQRFVEAESELRAYLSAAGKDVPLGNKLEVKTILADIPNHVGLVTFQCEVDGARVFVDTRRTATLPMSQPLRLDAGIHLIEVLADGFESSFKKVRIPGGEQLTFKIVLAESAEPTAEASFTLPTHLIMAGKYKEMGNGLVLAGGLLLGGGLGLAPVGAMIANMNAANDRDKARRTGYTFLIIGGVLLLSSLPLLITGTRLKLQGFAIENEHHEVSLAPYMTGIPGGAMAGVGGFF
ncbi:MAG: tetratricopeptide repeat protein [Deltaproteobacteria bacterium]|nr:tetratricopeptide repeat protein [Deltaproteobacteria bacterium]